MKKIIVWNIVKRCNLSCGFCFGPETGGRELSTEEAKRKIRDFAGRKITTIIFTGGEPLLRHDMVEIIKYAKSFKIFTILHTNGYYLDEKFIRNIRGDLDQINLPLDGSSSKKDAAFRGAGHFEKVFDSLRNLKGKGIRIVVSTVATKDNFSDILSIGRKLPNYIYKWRVFEFCPVGKARIKKREYLLRRGVFRRLENKIKKGDWGFKVQMVKLGDEKFYGGYEVEG